ncbi:hypothetical protein SDC9_65632 [bioreactor metagenome]|uniref:Uncharacterized protein n=1 Tax=bioreactor metagenome TaxID=1076179 RepID=A0A644XYW5_9ZZZZ
MVLTIILFGRSRCPVTKSRKSGKVHLLWRAICAGCLRKSVPSITSRNRYATLSFPKARAYACFGLIWVKILRTETGTTAAPSVAPEKKSWQSCVRYSRGRATTCMGTPIFRMWMCWKPCKRLWSITPTIIKPTSNTI